MPTRSLEYYKTLKFAEIDTQSGYLISQGFTYGGLIFSLSTNMQANLSTFIQMDNFSYVDYPVVLSSLDNLSVIEIQNQGELRQFDKDSYTAVSNILVAGNELKQDVRDALTIDDVNAVIDMR